MMMRSTTRAAATAALVAVLLAADVEAHGPGGAAEADAVVLGHPRFEYAPPEPGSYRLPAIGPAADGPVLDAGGARRRLHHLFGNGIVVLSFISTRCSDANGCPLATAVLHRVRQAAQGDPALVGRLRLVTLSFDVAHDTPAVLARYSPMVRGGAEAASRWAFAVPVSAAALTSLLHAYGQPVGLGGSAAPPTHLLRVYLIDGHRRIRNIYGLDFLDARLLLADAQTLLLEENGGRP